MSQAIALSHVSSLAPTDLGGCVMDLDPDVAFLLDGASKVQQLTDLSGAGNHATQGTAGSRPAFNITPLNGRRTVNFAGAQVLSHSLTLTAGTFAFVARQGGGPVTYQCLAHFGAGGIPGTYIYGWNSAAKWGGYFNADVNAATGLASWTVCCMVVRAPNDVDLWTNGVKLNVTAGVSYYSSGARGVGADDASQYFAGDLARLIAYSAPKTDADVQRLCRALGRRYGLAVA